MTMVDKARDLEAESELDKLEERLGLRATPAPAVDTTQTVSVTGGVGAPSSQPAGGATTSEAEKQLEELEKRLNAGNQTGSQ